MSYQQEVLGGYFVAGPVCQAVYVHLSVINIS